MLWARTLSGAQCGGYFLTGRSAASQARALRRGEGELIVSPTGESEHDPLRHFGAARERRGPRLAALGQLRVIRAQVNGPNEVSVVGLCAPGVTVSLSHSNGTVLPWTTMRWKFGTS